MATSENVCGPLCGYKRDELMRLSVWTNATAPQETLRGADMAKHATRMKFLHYSGKGNTTYDRPTVVFYGGNIHTLVRERASSVAAESPLTCAGRTTLTVVARRGRAPVSQSRRTHHSPLAFWNGTPQRDYDSAGRTELWRHHHDRPGWKLFNTFQPDVSEQVKLVRSASPACALYRDRPGGSRLACFSVDEKRHVSQPLSTRSRALFSLPPLSAPVRAAQRINFAEEMSNSMFCFSPLGQFLGDTDRYVRCSRPSPLASQSQSLPRRRPAVHPTCHPRITNHEPPAFDSSSSPAAPARNRPTIPRSPRFCLGVSRSCSAPSAWPGRRRTSPWRSPSRRAPPPDARSLAHTPRFSPACIRRGSGPPRRTETNPPVPALLNRPPFPVSASHPPRSTRR